MGQKVVYPSKYIFSLKIEKNKNRKKKKKKKKRFLFFIQEQFNLLLTSQYKERTCVLYKKKGQENKGRVNDYTKKKKMIVFNTLLL